ncbi:hypothetical protein G7Z17_g4239 [Cylindrodendrum hubeiense]|uniref:Uncharacterized protein n=1 Tax=Cylindrodendrum hubeiense TaxID=595255 RepID=A0A9P5HGE3_9HYPO|nr:hypothetical protein G7Z17_g4239 [Cylindrodendrum hubeiense]
MGLGDEALGVMLPALEWKKRQLRGDEVEESTKERNGHERDFANTASTILLSLCRNIATLYMGKLGWRASPLRLYLLLSGMNGIPRPGLRNVKQVEIITGTSWQSEATEYGLLNYQTYFNYVCRLPALESVVFDGVGDYEGGAQTLPQRASAIKKISITHADIPSKDLAMILQAPEQLEELTLSFGGMIYTHGESASVCPRTIGEHLSRHRETLKVLDIDIDNSIPDKNTDCEDLDSDLRSTHPINPLLCCPLSDV